MKEKEFKVVNRLTSTLFAILLLTFGLSFASIPGGNDSLQTASPENLQIEKAVACTGIEDREPVGVSSSFNHATGKVWLHSTVRLPKGESATIQHVWKRDGKVVSTVDLEVNGPRWRTRSYKTAPAPGSWTVDITAGGKVLESVSFMVK